MADRKRSTDGVCGNSSGAGAVAGACGDSRGAGVPGAGQPNPYCASFSAGDGHAAQGDGEVCLTALETCLKGTFELVVHKGMNLAMPRAITPTHYITLGLDADLDDAAKQALRDMIAWLVQMKGWQPAEAYVFCSLACDLRVTQLVDGNKGIHAMVARPLIE